MNSQFYANKLQELQKKRNQSPTAKDVQAANASKASKTRTRKPPSRTRTKRIQNMTVRFQNQPKMGAEFGGANGDLINIKTPEPDQGKLELAKQESTAKSKEQQIGNIQEKLKKITRFTSPQKRKLNISEDDPFASIFIHDQQYKKGKQIYADYLKKRQYKRKRNLAKKTGSAPPSSDSDRKSSDRENVKAGSWKNEQYWALPENVRKAIDVAKMKKKHSDFYYRLRILNDKIHIFTQIFYSKVPNYQMMWYNSQKKKLEEKLQKQKDQFEEDMKAIEKKIQKKAQPSGDLPVFTPVSRKLSIKSRLSTSLVRRVTLRKKSTMTKQITIQDVSRVSQGSPNSRKAVSPDVAAKGRKRYNSVAYVDPEQGIPDISLLNFNQDIVSGGSMASSEAENKSAKLYGRNSPMFYNAARFNRSPSPGDQKQIGQRTLSIRPDAMNFEKIHEEDHEGDSEGQAARKQGSRESKSLSSSSSLSGAVSGIPSAAISGFVPGKGWKQPSLQTSKPDTGKQSMKNKAADRRKTLSVNKGSIRDAVNEINYGVAELREMRMKISERTDLIVKRMSVTSDASPVKQNHLVSQEGHKIYRKWITQKGSRKTMSPKSPNLASSTFQKHTADLLALDKQKSVSSKLSSDSRAEDEIHIKLQSIRVSESKQQEPPIIPTPTVESNQESKQEGTGETQEKPSAAQSYVLNLQDQGMLNDAAATRVSQDTKEVPSVERPSSQLTCQEQELPQNIHIQFQFASQLDNAKSSFKRRSRASSNSYESQRDSNTKETVILAPPAVIPGTSGGRKSRNRSQRSAKTSRSFASRGSTKVFQQAQTDLLISRPMSKNLTIRFEDTGSLEEPTKSQPQPQQAGVKRKKGYEHLAKINRLKTNSLLHKNAYVSEIQSQLNSLWQLKYGVNSVAGSTRPKKGRQSPLRERRPNKRLYQSVALTSEQKQSNHTFSNQMILCDNGLDLSPSSLQTKVLINDLSGTQDTMANSNHIGTQTTNPYRYANHMTLNSSQAETRHDGQEPIYEGDKVYNDPTCESKDLAEAFNDLPQITEPMIQTEMKSPSKIIPRSPVYVQKPFQIRHQAETLQEKFNKITSRIQSRKKNQATLVRSVAPESVPHFCLSSHTSSQNRTALKNQTVMVSTDYFPGFSGGGPSQPLRTSLALPQTASSNKVSWVQRGISQDKQRLRKFTQRLNATRLSRGSSRRVASGSRGTPTQSCTRRRLFSAENKGPGNTTLKTSTLNPLTTSGMNASGDGSREIEMRIQGSEDLPSPSVNEAVPRFKNKTQLRKTLDRYKPSLPKVLNQSPCLRHARPRKEQALPIANYASGRQKWIKK